MAAIFSFLEFCEFLVSNPTPPSSIQTAASCDGSLIYFWALVLGDNIVQARDSTMDQKPDIYSPTPKKEVHWK